ncbi:hypothetical protein [Pararhizobium sp. PWRC1-1]|uniref:hypothetical protein n=1 Tax=Pararhizobium sp. PWRC1-1 TaxID=2804566 RepID=UPI003CEF4E22
MQAFQVVGFRAEACGHGTHGFGVPAAQQIVPICGGCMLNGNKVFDVFTEHQNRICAGADDDATRADPIFLQILRERLLMQLAALNNTEWLLVL